MRASGSTQADKSIMLAVRKKPGYSNVCSFTVDAQGINMTVGDTATNLDWNNDSTETLQLAIVALRGCTESTATDYPIDAMCVDSKIDDVCTDSYQVVDTTARTMVEGTWYPVYWDTSNVLHSSISFDPFIQTRLVSMAGGFTGTGGTTACTLAVYSGTTPTYSELLSSAALTNTHLASTFLGEGITSRLGERLLVRVSRATNFSVATWAVGAGSPSDPLVI
jgi:hypothetical protein